MHVYQCTTTTHLHVGAGSVWQLDGASETLVLLGIIVFQTNLQLNCLCEIPGIGLGAFQDGCEGIEGMCGWLLGAWVAAITGEQTDCVLLHQT